MKQIIRRALLHHISISVFFIILSVNLTGCQKQEEIKGSVNEKLIKDIIVKYNKALALAYKRLDSQPLVGVASEREIEKNIHIMSDYVKKKKIMESELVDIQFLDFQRKSRREADVEVKEKWRWRDVEKETGKELAPAVEEEQHLIYHMYREKKVGWIVGLVEFKKGK